jgi:FkbM family methyltransferase
VTTARQRTTGRPAGASIRARHFDSAPSTAVARLLLDEISATTADAGALAPRQPLALYGGGDLGRLARDHLRHLQIPIAAVIDRNAQAIEGDPGWAGIPVFHPDAVDPAFKQQAMLAVSIATSPFVPLQAALHADGWGEVVPYYDIAENFRDRHPLSNGWIAPTFGSEDIGAMSQALAGWDDDRSRAHHLQFIAWRRLRQDWTFSDAPVTVGDRFFIPEVVSLMTDEERYIDAGAHHGSVSRRFVETCQGRFKALTAIEPDPQSLQKLRETIAALPSEVSRRITVIDALLDSTPQPQRFHAGLGYASQIAASGDTERTSVTLDQLELAPTILKLHLEGYELPALNGAKATLSTYRPIVMATVYHNADGLHATANWLMRTLENYRFLFRLHSWCGTGAVIYALPQERL